jgi:hypothetical protein
MQWESKSRRWKGTFAFAFSLVITWEGNVGFIYRNRRLGEMKKSLILLDSCGSFWFGLVWLMMEFPVILSCGGNVYCP